MKMVMVLGFDLVVRGAGVLAVLLATLALSGAEMWATGLYTAAALAALVVRVLLNGYGPRPVRLSRRERVVMNMSFALLWFYTVPHLDAAYAEEYRTSLVEEVRKAMKRCWESTTRDRLTLSH